MGRLKSEVDKFIVQVRTELASCGFRLCFGRGKEVNGGGWRAEGFFCDRRKLIKVARGNSNWLGTLLHEYAHFLQWKQLPANIYNADNAAAAVVDEYLHRGKTASPALLRRAFTRVMAFERDAEIRAIRIAKAKGLPIDIVAYARHANLYIYSHHLMRDTGRWRSGGNPYRSWKIVDMMPTDFKAQAHRSIPKPVYDALATYYSNC